MAAVLLKCNKNILYLILYLIPVVLNDLSLFERRKRKKEIIYSNNYEH